MKKGLNLEEFKKEFDSDYKRRCEAQAKTIREQLDEIKEKDDVIYFTQTRCHELSHGKFCRSCDGKQFCRFGKVS